MAAQFQVTIDCKDPAGLAAFWAEALGYKLQDPPQGYESWPEFLAEQGVPEVLWNSANAVVDPDGRGPRLFFHQVPESKAVKNRLHLDLDLGGGESLPLEELKVGARAAADRLVGMGASKVQEVEERGEYWIVMLDPEGNEFCVF